MLPSFRRKEYDGVWASLLSTPIWQGSSGAFEYLSPWNCERCSFPEALLSAFRCRRVSVGSGVLKPGVASTAQDPRRAFLTRVTEHPPFPTRHSAEVSSCPSGSTRATLRAGRPRFQVAEKCQRWSGLNLIRVPSRGQRRRRRLLPSSPDEPEPQVFEPRTLISRGLSWAIWVVEGHELCREAWEWLMVNRAQGKPIAAEDFKQLGWANRRNNLCGYGQ